MMDDDDVTDGVPLLTRKIAWDILPSDSVQHILASLGMVPASKEGWQTEHDQSYARVDRCSDLCNYVEVFAEITNEILTAYMLDGKSTSMDGYAYAKEFLSKQNLEVMRRGIYATLSQLLDTGVLVYAKKD